MRAQGREPGWRDRDRERRRAASAAEREDRMNHRIKNIPINAVQLLRRLRRRVETCLSNQDGFGTVELVLLLLVLVGLVLIFKDKVSALVTSIFGKITTQAGKI